MTELGILRPATQREYRFLPVIFFLIAIRPVIDLQGKYEGEGINAGGVLGLFVAVLVLAEFMAYGRNLSKGFFFIFLAYMNILLIGGLHLLFVSERQDVLVTFSRFMVGFSVALLIPLLLQQRQEIQQGIIFRFFKVFLFASSVPAIIALLQFFGFYPFSYFDYVYGLPYGRPTGGYSQPNSLGRLMVFITIVTYIISSRNKIKSLWTIVIIAVASSTAYISTHRTSILILALVVLLFELRGFVFPNKVLAFRKLYLGVLSLFLAYILATLVSDRVQRFITPAFAERISYTSELVSKSFSHITSYKITDEDYLRGRGQMWQMSLELMRKAPVSTKIAGLGYEPIEAHNDFIRIYMVHGVVGLICYMSIFVILFVSSWRLLDPSGKLAIAALYIYLLLFSIPLHPTNYPYFMWLFFVCHAFIVCQPWRFTLPEKKGA